MLELWQTEWCPASRRVRERLTELGVDFLARQVPVEKEHRDALLAATGVDTIPVAVVAQHDVLVGETAILDWLVDHVPESDEAEAHRLKAAKARRRYLEEECECSQPATR